MKLKSTITPAEFQALPKTIQECYSAGHNAKKEAVYKLDVEPDAPPADPDPDPTDTEAMKAALAQARARIKEFRGNNDALAREIEDLKKAARTRPEHATLAEKVESLERALSESEKAAETHRRTLARQDFREKLTAQARKHGLNDHAGSDLLARAESAGFRSENGNIAKFDDDGNVVTGSNGMPVTLGSWIEQQKQHDAPHLFKQPVGTGGPGAPPGAPSGARVVIDATPEFIQQNMADIEAGKIILQRSEQP